MINDLLVYNLLDLEFSGPVLHQTILLLICAVVALSIYFVLFPITEIRFYAAAVLS